MDYSKSGLFQQISDIFTYNCFDPWIPDPDPRTQNKNHFQKQIEELKEMVSESHKKESVIFNLNIAMQNNEAAKHDPVYEDKLEHIQSEWKGTVYYLTFDYLI